MEYVNALANSSQEIKDLITSFNAFKDVDMAALSQDDLKKEINKRIEQLDANFTNVASSISDVKREIQNTKVAMRNLHISNLTDKVIEIEQSGVTTELEHFPLNKQTLLDSLQSLTQQLMNLNSQLNSIVSEKDRLNELYSKL